MVIPTETQKSVPVQILSNRPDAERAMRWLAHGYQRVAERDEPTLQRVVWGLIEEAVETIDRLPDQDKRWLSSGTRSGGWNMVGMTAEQAAEIERIRLMCAMMAGDGPASTGITDRSATDRALDVLQWFRYAHDYRHYKSLVKSATILARGSTVANVEAACRTFAPTRKSPQRQLIHEIKTITTGYISSGLKNFLGIHHLGEGVFWVNPEFKYSE